MYACLALGDSIIQGKEAPSCRGWVYLLKEEFESLDRFNYVFNLGIPGETTHLLNKRIESECQARLHHKREGDKILIILGVGTNDARLVGAEKIHETAPEQFRENLHKIFGSAKKFTHKVVVVGLLPVDEEFVNPYEDTFFSNDRQKEYNQILKEVSDFEGVMFIDLFSSWFSTDYKKLLSDGVHPNLLGHKRLFEDTYSFLKDL